MHWCNIRSDCILFMLFHYWSCFFPITSPRCIQIHRVLMYMNVWEVWHTGDLISLNVDRAGLIQLSNDVPETFIFTFKMLNWTFFIFLFFYPCSFFLHPEMAEDLIETHSVFSHALVSFSIGEYSSRSTQCSLMNYKLSRLNGTRQRRGGCNHTCCRSSGTVWKSH